MAHTQADNLLLMTRERMEGGTLTSGPFAPAAPVSNVLLNEPSDNLTWTDLSQTWLRSVYSSAKTWKAVWLGYLTCTDAATWRVVFRNGGIIVYDSGSLACVPVGEGAALRHRKLTRHCLHRLPAEVTADDWEITVSDPTNPAGVLKLGNVLVDNPFQPRINISYNAILPSLVDPSRVPTAGPGQRPPLNRAPYDVAGFDLRYASRAELIGELRDLQEFVGTTKPVLAVLEPNASTYRERMMIYGLQEALAPVIHPYFGKYETSCRIEELIP